VREAAVDVLVAAGVAAELLCCLGLTLARDGFDRLHFTGAGTTVPPLLIAAGVVVEEGLNQASINALLVAGLLLLLNPILVHATARAGRLTRAGELVPVDREPPDR
jgi:multicomponent Na+:H+ antiporter subunit G